MEMDSVSPLPGLTNCLCTTPYNSSRSTQCPISALCADGIRYLLPMATSTASIPFIPGILQARPTPTTLLTVHDYYLYIHSLHPITYQQLTTTRLLPRLHFIARSLSATSKRVLLGGYDGAYFSNMDTTTTTTNSTSRLQRLCGTEGFAVCVVKTTEASAAVALVDSRIAVWHCIDSNLNEHTPPDVMIKAWSSGGDRVTDMAMTESKLVVAYWSGLVAIYNMRRRRDDGCRWRSASSDMDVHAAHGDDALFHTWTGGGEKQDGDATFYTRGGTMIAWGDNKGDEDVVAVVDGDGRMVFVSLSTMTCVRRMVRDVKLNVDADVKVRVKGVADDNGKLLLWASNCRQLVSVHCPTRNELHVAQRVQAELGRRMTLKARADLQCKEDSKS